MYDFDKAKEEYRELCRHNETIQIFNRDWYWDAACENVDDWKVIIVKENNKIVAAFPFKYTKQKGLWHISNGFQVARGGIWIDYGNRETNAKKEHFTAKVIEEIIAVLPYFDTFLIAFDSRFTDWQPFYYNGFEQTTYYSYVIKEQEACLHNDIIDLFQAKRRKEIRQAELLYTVDCDMGVEEFYDYFSDNLKIKGEKISYSKETFIKLFSAVLEHSAGKIYRAKDEKGQIVAALGVVYDAMRTYTLFVSYSFAQNAVVGGRAYLDYICMKDAFAAGRIFDFEGSMMQSIAEYNSRYNADKEAYFVITKYSDKYRMRLLFSLIKNKLFGLIHR